MEDKIEKPEVAITERVVGVLRLVVPLAFIVLVALIATDVVDAEKVSAAVASVLAIIGLVGAWWKDNNMTLKAILRHMDDYEEE